MFTYNILDKKQTWKTFAASRPATKQVSRIDAIEMHETNVDHLSKTLMSWLFQRAVQ